LQEVESTLRKHNIPLTVTFEENRLGEPYNKRDIPPFIGAVVIESLPLRFMSIWKERLTAYHKHIPLYEVDAHNVIPVWETSHKQEFAARTIRTKTYTKVKEYLEDFTDLKIHTANDDSIKNFPPIDWDKIASQIICDESISGTGTLVPGEKVAQKILTHFLRTKLPNYNSSRNIIDEDGQSNLSPYISHGNISRRRILLELLKHTSTTIEDVLNPKKNGSSGEGNSLSAFIEETLVRAELAENFCYYNNHYNNTQGFPRWAQETLAKALSDKREHLYTRQEFEGARTHDDLWNAAQKQLVVSGKIHGYMRMYWAKKILEWTKTPAEALSIAIYLNDMYELDGRDPNGYVGCAWSIGGLHDRPWFRRPIFGTVRYMARSGVEKKGDVKKYIDTWLHGQQSLL
jgi:deoxyribodipyrimidine photo-lyase